MSVAHFVNWLQLQKHVVSFKTLLTTFLFIYLFPSSRDGRMLFDYLAEKHSVSNSTISSLAPSSSHDSCVNSALF